MQDSIIGLRLVMWERPFGDAGGEEGKLPMSIRRTLLTASTGIAAALACQGAAQAQTGEAQVEELVVTGIRASQAASIDTKRNADAVVDVITAEDVGKF